jgi:hypothetical protein
VLEDIGIFSFTHSVVDEQRKLWQNVALIIIESNFSFEMI